MEPRDAGDGLHQQEAEQQQHAGDEQQHADDEQHGVGYRDTDEEATAWLAFEDMEEEDEDEFVSSSGDEDPDEELQGHAQQQQHGLGSRMAGAALSRVAALLQRQAVKRRGSGEDSDGGERAFDPSCTSSHSYLGDIDELGDSFGVLPDGTVARLPLLMLDGVVLFPGCQLPLLLSTSQEQWLLERCLSAPPPLTRLLAVLPGPRSLLRFLPSVVCCTAEVRQMKRHAGAGGGTVAVLALGRQRAEVLRPDAQRLLAVGQSAVQVRILPEGCTLDVPQPIRCYESAIHPALAKPWDLRLLVGRVRQLLAAVLMGAEPVAAYQGSPLQLSYFWSQNLPLQPGTRQLLLSAPCAAERLRLLAGLLLRMDALCCAACGRRLAAASDVCSLTSEGVGSTFVNSAGYVHDLVTFRDVVGVRTRGRPETEMSWFPGYAWTICECGACHEHLGWHFTATRQGLLPRSFWGLRRPCLMAAGSNGGGAAPQHAGGGPPVLMALALVQQQ